MLDFEGRKKKKDKEKSEVNVDLAFSGKASLKVARVRVGW